MQAAPAAFFHLPMINICLYGDVFSDSFRKNLLQCIQKAKQVILL